MSAGIVINPITVRIAKNMEMFKTFLNEASINQSIQYILCLFNNDRQLLLGFKRNSQDILFICYDNLDRGLPAARDIKESIANINSWPKNTKFFDMSLMKKLRSYFGEASFAKVGMFGKIAEKIEMTPEFIEELKAVGVNVESFMHAMKDFNYFVKFEHKGHKYYAVPSLEQMKIGLEKDILESREVPPHYERNEVPQGDWQSFRTKS